jgi:hypothetical protein
MIRLQNTRVCAKTFRKGNGFMACIAAVCVSNNATAVKTSLYRITPKGMFEPERTDPHVPSLLHFAKKQPESGRTQLPRLEQGAPASKLAHSWQPVYFWLSKQLY